jgi:hypothetical protein
MNHSHKFCSILPNLVANALDSPVNYKLSAAIMKGGHLVSHPSNNTHCSVIRGCRCSSRHAEIGAILQVFTNLTYSRAKGWFIHYSKKKRNAGKKIKKKKGIYDLIVIRISGNGKLGSARPCFNCLNIMKIVGIKRVYYSIKPDIIVCERVRDMISIQASNVTKMIQRKYNHASYDDNQFFKNRLKKIIPYEIKINNLNFFLEYNYNIVLSTYSYKIINKNKIIFLDNNKIPFCEAYII